MDKYHPKIKLIIKNQKSKPMTKEELLKVVAKETGLSIKDCNAVIKSTSETLIKSFKKGEGIRFDLGTFAVKKKAATKGRNPKDGSEITIAARKTVSFKLAKQARLEMIDKKSA